VKTKLYLSIFCVGFFWGTTFLGIRIGVETIPPFLVSGMRNLVAGSLIMIYLFVAKKTERIQLHHLVRAFILALLMIVIGNGLTTYAEKYISSGLTSLISTLSPLVVLLFNLFLGYEKLSLKTVAGIFLGLFGMYLLYENNLSDFMKPEYRKGVGALLLAIVAWSAGTLVTKRAKTNPIGMLMNVSLQMLIAGTILFGLHLGIHGSIEPSVWSSRSIAAVIYLALFGSLIGYVAYNYLMTQWSSTRVTVLAYVNVVIALFFGWLILDETITSRIILATTVIVSGVVLVNYKKRT
jgi:drug/metabolite transporter (DMT)-like permease